MAFDLSTKQKQKLMPMPVLRYTLQVLAMHGDELQDFISNEQIENPVLELPSSPEAGYEVFLTMDILDESSNQDELRLQLRTLPHIPPEQLKLAEEILDYLDESGYISSPIDEIANDLGISKGACHEAVSLIQKLEPAGIGAGSLKECLKLQLEREEKQDHCAMEIVENHLEEIPTGRIILAKYDEKEVQRAISHIKALNPRPGLQKSRNDTIPVRPDLMVVHSEKSEELHVELINQPDVPDISSQYAFYLHACSNEDHRYLNEQIMRARLLRLAIQKRCETLLRIGNAILRHQHGYFCGGRPLAYLTMDMLAEELGYSRSTISRAASGKYLLYKNRVYALSTFFEAKVSSGHSRAHVKSEIKRILHSSAPLLNSTVV